MHVLKAENILSPQVKGSEPSEYAFIQKECRPVFTERWYDNSQRGTSEHFE
jgi:hypothetical protein